MTKKINKLALKLRELGEKSDYKGQGETFIKESGVMFEIVKAIPQISPNWAKDGKHGTCYSVTIARPKITATTSAVTKFDSIDNVDRRGWIEKKIQFFFWNSIAEKEAGQNSAIGERKPTAYSILAGLYTQVDTFENFCSDFGYSPDSRTAERTYNEIRELNSKLESVFTVEQLEAIAEIA